MFNSMRWMLRTSKKLNQRSDSRRRTSTVEMEVFVTFFAAVHISAKFLVISVDCALKYPCCSFGAFLISASLIKLSLKSFRYSAFRRRSTSSFTSMLESSEVSTIMSTALFILAEDDSPYRTNMDFFAPS
uniref:Uncharacterized protein n=2 Tax=Lepeophtheirus salmonis TaxID=72036 RepID=A0A0K2TKZ5_LEPSM